jgi:phosphatidylglycerophosphate synthase
MSDGRRIPLDQRLARPVARLLAKTPATPNAVTAASIAVGIVAAWLFAKGGGMAYWGAGVFVVAAWMDHIDGELARMTDRTSVFGHYFDLVATLINYALMFIGAGIGLAAGEIGAMGPVFGILAGFSVVAIIVVRMVVERRHGAGAVRQTVRGGFEIEDVLYVVAPVTWLGFLEPFIIAAGIGAPLFLLYV